MPVRVEEDVDAVFSCADSDARRAGHSTVAPSFSDPK
jgi:hypothetical protein